MKSIFLSFAITVVALISLTSQGLAQDNVPVLIDDLVPDLSVSIVIDTEKSPVEKNEQNSVHYRALKDFKKTFSTVDHANWIKTFDGGYVAHFHSDAIQTMVVYNGKGIWQHTIHRYSEKQLPNDIRKQVKSVYYDYAITGVTVVELTGNTVYLVNVQDDTSLKVIRIADDEMQEASSYIKG